MIELYLGDCRSILQNIDIKNAIIVTDPPFNIGYKYSEYKDRMPKNEYLDMLVGFIRNLPTVLIHYPESLYEVAVRGVFSNESC